MIDFNKKKLLASVLCANMFVSNLPIAAVASEISGVIPTGNTYNIEAAKVSGTTGFRHYDKFDLTQGDVANLIYKDNYSKFVNLVNSQVNINGIVNTMKGNNFYNGHAIFVSPNGIVIGASGVLNVGSLSLITPSQSKFDSFKNAYDAGSLSNYEFDGNAYKALITDSHGNVVINGKILARGDVNVYGDTITIQGSSNNKAGIISGWNDTSMVLSDIDTAKNVFNNLVSNNITDTTNFALENGKIKIVAGFKGYDNDKKPDGISKKAEVTIENAQLGADEVEIKANSTREFNTFNLFPKDTEPDYSLYDLADADDAISSKIEIKDSDISANKLDISATSQAELNRNLNLTVPTVFLWMFDGDAHLDEFFSNDVYTGFEGVRTSAVVNIINSQMQTKHDLSISTKSSSDTGINSETIDSLVGEVIPHIFYGYGTKTESKINITNESVLKAGGDINLNAYSENIMNAKVTNDAIGINLNATDAYDLAFVKNSTIADTKVLIDNSTVEGNNVNAQALAYNKLDNNVILHTRIGENDYATHLQGGSSTSLAGLLNATDIKSAVEVKNGSKIIAKEDVSINAYNINEVSNRVDSEVVSPTDYTVKWKEGDSVAARLFDVLGRIATGKDLATHITFSDITDKFNTKAQTIKNQIYPNGSTMDSATFQAGAAVLWNNAQTTNNVIIDNSTINAKNIDIKAHTVDLTHNESDAYAEEAAKWGGAFSLLVNKQKNDNKSEVLNSSQLFAQKDINVNSIVELPAQQGTFGVSTHGAFGIDLTLGFNFNFSSTDEFSIDWHSISGNPSAGTLMPQGGVFGFYNNYAVSAGGGEKASISGAVVSNEVQNNSDINITNSTITAGYGENNSGNLIMNSVVSSSIHDAVDFFDRDDLIAEIKGLVKKTTNKWNVDGATAVGGSVLVQNIENNARITVDNSALTADGGKLELNTAAEQSYLNLITPGGKAKTFGVVGAVTVQDVSGTTSSTVKNNSVLKAGSISIESGKANVQFTEKGSDTSKDGVKFLDEKNNVKLATARDVKDHVTTIALNGTLVTQSGSDTGNTSSGAAFGASVIAKTIDRTVKSEIDSATLTADTIDVKAESYNKDILITLAGAFAGGVSPKKETQQSANQGQGGENGPQQMQNAGNWMEILDNAGDNEEDILGLNNLFNENNANAEGAANAAGQAGGAEQLAGGGANPQGASGNFSLALAGSVSVVNDKSVVQTEIKNSALNVGNALNVTADRDNFVLNATGGLAKSGSVGAGAAVNVYSDKGGVSSTVEGGNIIFTTNNEKELNVISNGKHMIINAAAGVGIASNQEQGTKAAVGGSFNTNTLKDYTQSSIKNTTIKNTEGKTGDIDVKVTSTADSTVWNVGGGIGYAGASSNSAAIGAGVAGNLDLLKQNINSEIAGSTLSNISNIEINSDLTQTMNSIGIAGAIVTGANYSFNIDGALGLELAENTVSALLKDSTVSASGDIKTIAESKLKGRDLTGAVDVSTASNSVGIGIGSVINIDNSTINAHIDNSKTEKSKSVEVKADSSDTRQFLAVNAGIQTGTQTSGGINANGIVSVLKTTVDAEIMNGSEITSDGDVKVNSLYANEIEGITAVANKTNKLSLGANVITNYFNNDITAEITNNSEIKKAANIAVSAKSSEYISLIPVAVAIAQDGVGAVAADVSVNIIKDKTNAIVAGKLTTTGDLTLAADSETTIYNRGGTLALAGADAITAFGGAINVDYINKTVNAQIGDTTSRTTVNADGKVSTSAVSTNSLGGTKNSSGDYDRDDITSDNYQDNLMKKDSDGNYSGINYNNNFDNWNMFYNLSAGATAAISGSVIVKTVDNDVTAQILNSDLTAKNLNMVAEDYSVKNIIAGQIAASKTAAIGVQVLVTNDKSDTLATISNGSNLTISETLNMSALNIKDNNQIVVAGNFAKSGAVGANVLHNTINDNAIAKIDSSTIKAGILNLTADEDMNASKIVVAASGAGQGIAINVSPLINYYGDDVTKNEGESDADFEARRRGKTIAEISNSTINDAKITLQSDTDIKTRDIAIGVAGAGQGFSASGLVIKNTYNTITKSIIDNNSVINTTQDLTLNANSYANANNWIVGVSGVGQGASIIADVLINDLTSVVETAVVDSTITKAGNITLNTNKGKKDKFNNQAITGNVSGEGAAASANVIYNLYNNSVISRIYNSSVDSSNSITAQAFSDRGINNVDIGLGVAGIGADLLANALVNKISTNTLAYIDAQSKSVNSSGMLTVNADDNTFSDNKMGFGVAAGLGAALGANINLYYSDNLVQAEILSNSGGQINAGNADVSAKTTGGLDNTNVGVSAGLVGIAGDVVVVKMGKNEDYTSSETSSGVKTATDRVKNIYDFTTKSNTDTGAIARVNGNLKTSNNVDINAESKIKGKDSDTVKFTNVQVTAGLGTGSVAVRDVQLNNNTVAEITGGKIESTSGDISLNAKNTSNVEIKTVKVDVSGVTFSGGSAIYNNKSNTVAQIGSTTNATTVQGKDINLVTNSTSKSDIDSTTVVVTGGNIVSVDLNENKDENNSIAQIIGKTDITSTGNLTLHSTVNTDLSAKKATVSVTGVNMVSVSKNEVNASTISKAVMDNVDGTISANGIDIITDYDTMSAFAKSNVTAVKFGDLYSGDSSGATMNAEFTSGINSESALKIANTGATNITTAKKNGSNSISATSEINNVHVSLQGFVAETSAKAENTATSNILLKAKEHSAVSLAINSYLDSSADANAGATKATVGIGVNLVNTDAKNTSTLNMDIAGVNTITGDAIINATNNSKVHSDMSAFNFGGLIGGGQKIRISSELTSNSTGNIGGKFNAKNTDITFNTTRESVMSNSSGSGSGIVNVSDTKAENKLNGNSTLNVDGFESDSSVANNELTIKNLSTNTFDNTSHDSSGGFINVSTSNIDSEFDTSTITNIKNSNINSKGKITYEVGNNAIVKDTASMGGGGFVAVMSNDVNNTYKSGAKLSIEDTEIHAHDISLKTSSDITSAANSDGYVDYVGKGGGFVASNKLNLKNTLNQSSEIELKNSKLYAENNSEISTNTSSNFKQRMDDDARGFVSLPKSDSTLNVTNTQNINLDSSSIVSAVNNAIFNFNSDNTLESRVVSKAKNFAGAPQAYSYLELNVNNTLNNDGLINAGNLVDINYMDNSSNNLTVWAETEAKSAIAKTYEDGYLHRYINNTLNVSQNAKIVSNKDIEVSYSSGNGSTSGQVHWDTTSYALFGIPIHNSKTYDITSTSTTNKLDLKGEMIAGQGNSKYMKINQDGTVDNNATKGFVDSDYTLTDGEVIDGQKIKDKKLADIKISIEDAEDTETELSNEITKFETAKKPYEDEKTSANAVITEFNNLLNKGYTLANNETDSSGNSEFNTIVQNDLKSQIIGKEDTKLTDVEYTALLNAYATKMNEIADYNDKHPDNPKPNISMLEFLTSYSLSDSKKTTVKSAYNTVNGNLGKTEKGHFNTYKSLNGKNYLSVKNPKTVDNVKTCDEIIQKNEHIAQLNKLIKPYDDKIAVDKVNISKLANSIKELKEEQTKIENTPASDFEIKGQKYAIAFHDIKGQDSHIKIDGMANDGISGSGNMSIAADGIKIDNYSTRSIIFNDIILDKSSQNDLFILGKSFSEFADQQQAVNGTHAYEYMFNNAMMYQFSDIGTSGVHYSTKNTTGITGITVNNFYDTANPLASTLTIPNPILVSDITFNGQINTNNKLNVFNDSGSITAENILTNGLAGAIDLVAVKGDVNLTSSGTITLKSDDSIFAGNSVNIKAKETDIKGNISAGYNSDLTLTITEDILNNLAYDTVTGENILINLGDKYYTNENNNIKALYKDGQIYLFNINEEVKGTNSTDRGKVAITADNNSVTGTVKTYDGYQNITVENQTNRQLNVYNVSNLKSVGGKYINNQKEADAVETVETAITKIISNGKLVLNGIAKNGANTLDANTTADAMNSTLLIQSQGGGLEVKKQSKSYDGKTVSADSIYAAGDVFLLNISEEGTGAPGAGMTIDGDITAQGNIYIHQDTKGTLNISSYIHQIVYPDNSDGVISIQNLNSSAGGVYITDSAFIHNDKGNVQVLNYSAADIKADGAIYAPNGTVVVRNQNGNIEYNGPVIGENVTIENDGDSPITVTGIVIADGGKINIQNEYGNLTIADTARIMDFGDTANNITIANEVGGEKLIIAGSVENYSGGNISILNNGAGDADISGYIYNPSGNIIIDNEKNKLNITGLLQAEAGSLTIRNNGDDAVFDGITLVQNGNIVIENGTDNNAPNGSKMTISADIYHNNFDENASGLISITNAEKAGELIINSSIQTSGTGEMKDGILTSIIIDNQSSSAGLSLSDNEIKSRLGDIIIKNKNSNLSIVGGIVENTENGNIKISNSGGLFTTTADITNQLGNIVLTNDGTGKLLVGGLIENKNGNTQITNNGYVTELSGKIENSGGNTTISNTNGLVRIDGNILNNGGNVTLTNTGSGTDIEGNIYNSDGLVAVANSNGILRIASNSYISNVSDNGNSYAVTIANAGDNLELVGNITNNIGDIEITNTGNNANIRGSILTELGNIDISNSNIGALNISGTITDENGNITIQNSGNNGFVLTQTGKVYADNGRISIRNSKGAFITEKDSQITSNGQPVLLMMFSLDPVSDISLVNEDTAAQMSISGNVVNTGNKGIYYENNSSSGITISSTANIQNQKSNTFIQNNAGNAVIENGAKIINSESGNIFVYNSGNNLSIEGLIEQQGSDTGIISINNFGTGALRLNEKGLLHTIDGNIELTNSSVAGIDITGLIRADKQNIKITNSNSDIRIGSYEDANDKYINTLTNDIIITQSNGNILNSITDTVAGRKHANYDIGTPNGAYKTLILSGNNINITVLDGDIGQYNNSSIPAGTSFEASTRDYTDSINVNAAGIINAKAVNSANTNDRLINIRAKESDLNIDTIETDGNILLTAADWKQADIRPVDKSDNNYFKGYSIINSRNDNASNITGKNISLIASNAIGTATKKLIYEEDTLNGVANVSLSAESENGLYLTGRTNSINPLKVNKIISKHDFVNIDFENDAIIDVITADKGLLITQKAKNLTIKEFGTSGSSGETFDDILYPHDDIKLGTDINSVIPKYVDIKVLDSDITNGGDSNLKIYTGYVRGNNGDNVKYYSNGKRLADVTLMADNIYINSDKMISPTYEYRLDLGNNELNYVLAGETTVKQAKGINAYGEGTDLILDILGVDKNYVDSNTLGLRNSYNEITPIPYVPAKFLNTTNAIPYYGSAKNVVLSVNDYSNRDAIFDSLYTNSAYINVNKDNLIFDNAYIKDFAEIKVNNKVAVVDNEFRRLLPNADIQLYTEKTGSFALRLDRTINMQTTAPTVYNEPHKLVNGYHSEWNFVNKGQKESKDLIDNTEMAYDFQNQNINTRENDVLVFDANNDVIISSDAEIYSISTKGAIVKNDKKLKKGKNTTINIKFDDVDINVNAKVVKIEGEKAELEFTDLPKDVANKMIYKYMQKANANTTNTTTSLL